MTKVCVSKLRSRSVHYRAGTRYNADSLLKEGSLRTKILKSFLRFGFLRSYLQFSDTDFHSTAGSFVKAEELSFYVNLPVRAKRCPYY